MTGYRIEGAWRAIRDRLKARGKGLVASVRLKAACRRREKEACMQERYGVSKEEARRRKRDWIREPGVLDDWNDTRSILDL
jgi:hypothetical protein